MSNVARLRREEALQTALYLGPAEVVRVLSPDIEISLSKGGLVQARPALGYAYEAQAGDTVLAIGHEEGYWIIGVIHGQGKSILHFPADVELHSAGTMRITADTGIELKSPELALTANKLRAIASEVVHTFGTLRQRIRDLMSTHAGQSHTLVEGTAHTQAKSASILTEQKVSINGKEVHLG